MLIIGNVTFFFFFPGNGGSTLYALQQLSEIYGKALGGMRVILIHAGLSLLNGFSRHYKCISRVRIRVVQVLQWLARKALPVFA